MTGSLIKSAPEFKHSFSSCSRCYATLRLYHLIKSPDEVTTALNISPTRQQEVGQPSGKRTININGWFLSTQDMMDSRDIRAHIWDILEKIEGKSDSLMGLAEGGWIIDVFCFWESASGNGGPILDAVTMSLLGDLHLALGFDVWIE